jgi:hypothetical protein
MGSIQQPKRPVRIMNISGSPVDRREALSLGTASSEPIDVFVGDWMSELNMPAKAYAVSQDPTAIGYELSFLEALEPAIDSLAKKKQKLIANAGTVATKQLFDRVTQLVADRGLSLIVAWVEGDLVMDNVKAAIENKDELRSVCTGMALKDWPYEPLFAQCYLGSAAVVKALHAGADIVLCGRIADASPIVAAATWWHDWQPEEYDKLAQSLIAGHLIECSTYVTGGNFTGFVMPSMQSKPSSDHLVASRALISIKSTTSGILSPRLGTEVMSSSRRRPGRMVLSLQRRARSSSCMKSRVSTT